MHSFHQSRGRIFFEVLCVLAISASCVGTWMQTGASALLPAAAVTLLYGLVHLFDMRRPRPVSADRQPVAVAAPEAEFVTEPAVEVAEPVAEPPVVVRLAKEAELAELPAPAVRKARQPKAPRKASRAAAVKETKPVQLVPPVEREPEPEPAPDAMPVAAPEWAGEVVHTSLSPLFEPEPFVRQQRATFGRKSG